MLDHVSNFNSVKLLSNVRDTLRHIPLPELLEAFSPCVVVLWTNSSYLVFEMFSSDLQFVNLNNG